MDLTQLIDWSQLGVNVGVVTGIIAVVQFLKSTFLKDLPGWAYLIISMAFSAISGYLFTEAGQLAEVYIRAVVSYMTAAAWLYAVAEQVPAIKKVLKKKEISQ